MAEQAFTERPGRASARRARPSGLAAAVARVGPSSSSLGLAQNGVALVKSGDLDCRSAPPRDLTPTCAFLPQHSR
jgi:hypothetical protein